MITRFIYNIYTQLHYMIARKVTIKLKTYSKDEAIVIRVK